MRAKSPILEVWAVSCVWTVENYWMNEGWERKRKWRKEKENVQAAQAQAWQIWPQIPFQLLRLSGSPGFTLLSLHSLFASLEIWVAHLLFSDSLTCRFFLLRRFPRNQTDLWIFIYFFLFFRFFSVSAVEDGVIPSNLLFYWKVELDFFFFLVFRLLLSGKFG